MFDTPRVMAVIGLGYVGLPVAAAFSYVRRTIGFDLNSERIKSLEKGVDLTGEVSASEINFQNITFTTDEALLKNANFFILAVPTPVDNAKRPDLTALKSASKIVAKAMGPGSIVVVESTVYPGVTEEVCLPILEKYSGLKAGLEFKVGYSPERINPGDKEHRFRNILKVVSGQDDLALEIIAREYASVVDAGVFKASSIKVAEAAKVIENTQRDINIALMNELALIFDRMGIETHDVLEAASTKWNFLKFTPGLVGGHCIGVDPYYLTYKAQQVGIFPEVILAGRRINDNMGKFVAEKTVKELIKLGKPVSGSLVTILGMTFKENCTDIRNSKVIDIINELQDYGIEVQVHDPMADLKSTKKEYGITLVPWNKLQKASAVIVAVAHRQYKELRAQDFENLLVSRGPVMDIKGILDKKNFEKTPKEATVNLWRP